MRSRATQSGHSTLAGRLVLPFAIATVLLLVATLLVSQGTTEDDLKATQAAVVIGETSETSETGETDDDGANNESADPIRVERSVAPETDSSNSQSVAEPAAESVEDVADDANDPGNTSGTEAETANATLATADNSIPSPSGSATPIASVEAPQATSGGPETGDASKVTSEPSVGTATSSQPASKDLGVTSDATAFIDPVIAAARKQPMSPDFTLMATVDGAPPMDFGQTEAQVGDALANIFGATKYRNAENWKNLAVVADQSGDYIRYRSNVGNNSRQQFNVPITPSQESYLVYRFQLEPGFDAGDGDGSEGSPSWGTGIKMPGLMRGGPAENTGGNHTAGGFSGRLMIRGTRASDGQHYSPREGITLAAYVYGQKINGSDIANGYGEDYYFLDGFDTRPFEGIQSGMVEGVGDPRIWDLEVGRWVTVVLGYRVEGPRGWFKAWTMTDGIDSTLQPRLFIDNIDWTGGWEGADSLLMQQYYGGSGAVWHPDTVSYIRFKDFGVFRNQDSALSFANQQ